VRTDQLFKCSINIGIRSIEPIYRSAYLGGLTLKIKNLHIHLYFIATLYL